MSRCRLGLPYHDVIMAKIQYRGRKPTFWDPCDTSRTSECFI